MVCMVESSLDARNVQKSVQVDKAIAPNGRYAIGASTLLLSIVETFSGRFRERCSPYLMRSREDKSIGVVHCAGEIGDFSPVHQLNSATVKPFEQLPMGRISAGPIALAIATRPLQQGDQAFVV